MKKLIDEENLNIGKTILLKNNQFIVVNKPPGLGIQSDKTGDKSLIDFAEIYTKKKLFITHRIDRPVSGAVVLAKNSKCAAQLNEQFHKRTVDKTYLAIIKNAPKEKEGTLLHFISKNEKQNKSIISDVEIPNSKNAELKYEVMGQSDNYTILKIKLITGRHHQIRAQLAAIGSPIKGDVKYGARRGNKDRSIHLHAWEIGFHHPITKERISVVAAPPEDALWNYFAELI